MKNKDLKIEKISIGSLTRPKHNAKIHTPEHIQQIKNSIREFGMIQPIVIHGEDNVIRAGEGRYLACKELGYKEIYCVQADHLTEEQARAFALADNLTQQATGFDLEILNLEIADLDFNFTDFGLNFDLNVDLDTDNIVVEEDRIVPSVL